LGTERPEPNVMRRPPRRQSQALVDRRLLARAIWLGSIETVLCYVGFFVLYYSLGYTDLGSLPRMDLLLFDVRVNSPLGRDYIMATTIFHLGVVAGQIGSAFVCRTEKEQVHRMGFFSNRFLLLGIAGEIAIIWILINFRPLAEPFEHIPPPLPFWLILIVYPWIVYILDWLRKVVARSREKAVAPAG
jgi:magnesium-transporting ATPase (P-type)